MKNAAWTGDNQDSGILSGPLSFPRSGFFRWFNADLAGRDSYGNYWSLRSYDTTSSSYLDFSNTNLNPQYSSNRGVGIAVRCAKQLSKSFTNLINTSYSMKNNTTWTGDNSDTGPLSNPLSFLRNGYFSWGDAGLYVRGSGGYYWSLRSADTARSNFLSFYSTYLYPQNNYDRGGGFAVRCVQILHRSH